MITITITEQGDALFLKQDSTKVFTDLGTVITRRGSYVTPVNPVLNLCFKVIRRLVPDESKIAAWTRTWGCTWCAEIVNGPVLWNSGTTRAKAIEAEVSYLNNQFLEV